MRRILNLGLLILKNFLQTTSLPVVLKIEIHEIHEIHKIYEICLKIEIHKGHEIHSKATLAKYVRPSVYPSTKRFFDINETWHVGRGR